MVAAFSADVAHSNEIYIASNNPKRPVISHFLVAGMETLTLEGINLT